MRDLNAKQLLAKVLDWSDDDVLRDLPTLQLLADYKYDTYQRFGPGKRFIESLALWLNQFDRSDRPAALALVLEKVAFFSDAEFSHLVRTAYPDIIVQERIRSVAEELDIPFYRIRAVTKHDRFNELRLKSLYLGLSDGARTSELRRASDGEISNEQIWQAYELGSEKSDDMVTELRNSLRKEGLPAGESQRFNVIWLLDDFSGSGNTYLRFDRETKKFKGKIKKIYAQLERGDLVDTSHYEVFLLLYVATRQAIDHIEYWAERFTSENGYKPLRVKVSCQIDRDTMVTDNPSAALVKLLDNPAYCDQTVVDKHFRVGGTDDARFGFAGCALPVVLSHNTPNNSIYILWGPETYKFEGLFPRLSRHREF